jgi:hypothetical protein
VRQALHVDSFDPAHVLLVGPPGAVAEARARNHYFREFWGSAPLQVVDQVKYFGIRLNCAWTWETHIAAAYRKGLGAFHAWRPVLMSSRISVAVKLRIIHSIVRPALEYGKNEINYSGTTPYSLRASASLHMEEYTCNSKGGNHQKPQTHPTEQLV